MHCFLLSRVIPDQEYICFYVLKVFLKNIFYFLFFWFKLIFLNVFKLFSYTNIKNKLKKIKKYYFNVFLSEKYVKKQLLNTILTTPPKIVFRNEVEFTFFKKLNFILLKIIFFYVFRLFWCAHVKNNFFKIKNIYILIYFQVKNTLNRNYYHTLIHFLRWAWSRARPKPTWLIQYMRYHN